MLYSIILQLRSRIYGAQDLVPWMNAPGHEGESMIRRLNVSLSTQLSCNVSVPQLYTHVCTNSHPPPPPGEVFDKRLIIKRSWVGLNSQFPFLKVIVEAKPKEPSLVFIFSSAVENTPIHGFHKSISAKRIQRLSPEFEPGSPIPFPIKNVPP